MKTPHTPTPWFISARESGEVYIATENPEVGLTVATAHDVGDEDGAEVAEANAALIVRAVNCHENLLETLKNASANLAGFVSSNPAIAVVMKDIREAIVRAEGQGD